MLVNLLTSLSLGFIFGVFSHSLFSPHIPQFDIALGIVIFAITCSLFSKLHNFIFVLVFFFCGIAFGMVRYGYDIDTYASTIFDPFVDTTTRVELYGTIRSDPLDKTQYSEFVFDTEYLVIADTSLPARTRVLVKSDYYSDFEYGNTLFVRGVLKKPSSFVTDLDREFDYGSYLAKDGIYYSLSYAEAEKIGEGAKSITRGLYTLKRFFLNNIYRFVPEPQAGLLAGVLFGQQSALSDEYDKKFRIVGLTHIVVLSGYNVSVVILVFMKLFAFLPRLPRAILAVLSIIAFALLVGAGPTVIRASLMAMLIVLAELLHRRYHIERALYVAGIAMILWNPKVLYFDISFQLSFLATYGLIVLSPIVERWVRWIPKFLLMRESAVATLSAQIMVLPLLIYKIGEVSVISPLVNIIVLFAVPWSMGLGFLSALSVPLSGFLASIIASLTTITLSYQLSVVDLFASIPFAMIPFPPFHWGLMLVMYGAIIFWIFRVNKKISEV